MPAKKTAPAKKAAPTAKKASPAKPVALAKKRAAPKKAEQIDYRLLSIQKAVAVVDEEFDREMLERFLVELVQKAHLLSLARTEAGLAYRKHLSQVSDASRRVAWAAITDDEERIADATAELTDQMDYSPFSDSILAEVSGDHDLLRLAQSVFYTEEIDLAFTIRGRD